MTIKDLVSKLMHRKEEYKQELMEAERQRKIQKILDDRSKNSNERELERFMEEDRQKKIKYHLEKYRKMKRDEWWHGKQMLNEKYIYKKERPLLKERNLFVGKSNGGMFAR